jgi:hypothetical protein
MAKTPAVDPVDAFPPSEVTRREIEELALAKLIPSRRLLARDYEPPTATPCRTRRRWSSSFPSSFEVWGFRLVIFSAKFTWTLIRSSRFSFLFTFARPSSASPLLSTFFAICLGQAAAFCGESSRDRRCRCPAALQRHVHCCAGENIQQRLACPVILVQEPRSPTSSPSRSSSSSHG